MEMKTTLNHCISSALEPQKVFIGTRGTGARGTTPGPKPAAVIWWSRGASATHDPFCLLSVFVPGF